MNIRRKTFTVRARFGVFPHRPLGGGTDYINVDDLAAYRKKVVAAGGKIHVEKQDVPGMGSFALFTDPEGRMMGLWQTASGQ